MSPPWRYRCLLRVLSPVLMAYTIWRGFKDGGRRYCAQRLGFYSQTPHREALACSRQLWVHAASVGEVITVQPLLKVWLSQHPDAQVVFTTGTPTGAAVLKGLNLSRVHHQYLPLDFPGACRRFFNQLKAREAWIVETEIWPCLYAHCEKAALSLTIVNGRLSDKTSKQEFGFLRTSYQRALRSVRVLARSREDQAKFVRLGANPEQVHIAGNLKYANPVASDTGTALIPQAYVLAASTHEDEELQLARNWLNASQGDTSLLVIAPRHPERAASIQQQFRSIGMQVAQRSKGELPRGQDRIYLADSLGELQAWYQYASAAFVGGSLIPRGGHNVLEPARYACPVIVGPYTHNFDDIIGLMIAKDAIDVCHSAEDVCEHLSKAAHFDEHFVAMGKRAQSLARDSAQVLDRYQDLLWRTADPDVL